MSTVCPTCWVGCRCSTILKSRSSGQRSYSAKPDKIYYYFMYGQCSMKTASSYLFHDSLHPVYPGCKDSLSCSPPLDTFAVNEEYISLDCFKSLKKRGWTILDSSPNAGSHPQTHFHPVTSESIGENIHDKNLLESSVAERLYRRVKITRFVEVPRGGEGTEPEKDD